MTTRSPIARAIRRREVRAWFGAPASYVFVAAFALASAVALFRDEFFRDNQATLDAWNSYFPLLLAVFAPLVTMGLWASERRSGTEELLLTLPTKDVQIVLGKYLAAIQIWTITLLFTLPLVFVLMALGRPDPWLLAGNYLGFWLFGVAVLGAGLVGSQLSDNLTVAFILGAVFSALVVVLERGLALFFRGASSGWIEFLPGGLFDAIGRGLFSIAALISFLGLAFAFGYLNVILLARRHWHPGEGRRLGLRVLACLVGAILLVGAASAPASDEIPVSAVVAFCGGALLVILALTPLGAKDLRSPSWHGAVRFVSILGGLVGFTIAAGLSGRAIDTTSERIHSLSADTERLIRELREQATDRPVIVEAFVSREVPREYARVRRDLRNLLQRYDELGGDAVRVRIVELEPYSLAAREVEAKYGIKPETVVSEESSGVRSYELHMGLAFTSGARQLVLPFLYEKLSVEYELTRSIRSVAAVSQRKLGVLKTGVNLFGGFDMRERQPLPRWDIISELEHQYRVVEVESDSAYPSDLDALLVPMASSLVQPDLDRLRDWIRAGGRALILDDPLPNAAPGLEPSIRTVGGETDPMFGMGGAPPQAKGDIAAFLREFQVDWDYDLVATDAYIPFPDLREIRPDIVFVSPTSGAAAPLHPTDAATKDLQELVFLSGGTLRAFAKEGHDFTPLVTTSRDGGTIRISQLQRRRPLTRAAPEQVLAARVRAPSATESGRPIEFIFVADLDLIGPAFFQLRRQRNLRGPEFHFDNIPFVLNCVDTLTGDVSFVQLRNRRPAHRVLETIAAKDREFQAQWNEQRTRAEEEAEAELAKAKARLDDAVKAIEQNERLDDLSKAIRVEAVRQSEQTKLDQEQRRIDAEKARSIAEARRDRVLKQDELRSQWSLIGWTASPLIAILAGFCVFFLRTRSERANVPAARRRSEESRS